MEPILESRESLVKSWNSLLTESISLDSWGQVIEASHGYKMYVGNINGILLYSKCLTFFVLPGYLVVLLRLSVIQDSFLLKKK